MYFVMFASALLYDILVPKSRVTDAYVKRLCKLKDLVIHFYYVVCLWHAFNCL